jgi:thiol-disulfide isomerase/thioredoxin
MAGRVNVADQLVAISSVEQLDKYVELSEEKIVIIDLHEEWCGPCMVTLFFVTFT